MSDLAERVIDAQRPIRILNALRWSGRVEEQFNRAIASGARELVLLGQNVNAYHGEGPDGRIWGLAGLLRRLAEFGRGGASRSGHPDHT